MDLLFIKRHNVCAFLDANHPKSAEFVPVMNFLANSNISFAIKIVTFENMEHIRATVHDQEILFSEASIREAFHFNDDPATPIEFPNFYVKECFRRMGHPDEFKNGQIIKNSLPSHWRYMYIIINQLLPKLQQGGHVLVFYHMMAKTLSYMKSTNKRTNRAIADIILFGHVIGEEEESVPDFDPNLPVEEDDELFEEEEVEIEQDEGNQQED
ncbi:hypothetical protein L1987_52960 [Smallanthus sonchifolius]|uniref:Uncharacterized protein n=1 Tax=Smallanthus sonchifolius TaxID=185202 RepID=A0ACB9EV80_9ASTR|nr:hypothetical protein L1987_52960 [Smallanthus sonchifolius]